MTPNAEFHATLRTNIARRLHFPVRPAHPACRARSHTRSRSLRQASIIPSRSRSCRAAVCSSRSAPAECEWCRRRHRFRTAHWHADPGESTAPGWDAGRDSRPGFRKEPHALLQLRHSGGKQYRHGRSHGERQAVEGRESHQRRQLLREGKMLPRRIVQARDGTLLVVSAEVASGGPNPQSLQSLMGKVLRINTDGTIPKDNPFLSTPDADPALYAIGFRDQQGAALHPRPANCGRSRTSRAAAMSSTSFILAGTTAFPSSATVARTTAI